jgi:hypothetical protein
METKAEIVVCCGKIEPEYPGYIVKIEDDLYASVSPLIYDPDIVGGMPQWLQKLWIGRWFWWYSEVYGGTCYYWPDTNIVLLDWVLASLTNKKLGVRPLWQRGYEGLNWPGEKPHFAVDYGIYNALELIYGVATHRQKFDTFAEAATAHDSGKDPIKVYRYTDIFKQKLATTMLIEAETAKFRVGYRLFAAYKWLTRKLHLA